MDTSSLSPKMLAISSALHKNWLSSLKVSPVIYLYSMYGCGKTLQSINFAKKHFSTYIHLSCYKNDCLNDFENSLHSASENSISTLIILDDMHFIIDPVDKERLFSILSSKIPQNVNILLLSNSRLPDYLIPLRISQQLTVLNRHDLTLNITQIKKLLSSSITNLTKEDLTALSNHCFELTKGYALLVQMYVQYTAEFPDDPSTAKLLALRDICYQLDNQLFAKWPKEYVDIMVKLSVFDSFSYDMAKLFLNEDAENILLNIMSLDSFLQFKAPNTFHMHPMFLYYFNEKLKKLDLTEQNNIYETAALFYEQNRNFKDALRCYKLSNNIDKITEIVIYLLENADGCYFAELSEEYINLIPMNLEQQNPSIIGAKAMLAAYQMEPKKSKQYLKKLKDLVHNEYKSKEPTGALSVYVRTLIASPYVTSAELKENLILCSKYIAKHGIILKNIMPTSNSASILNGGIDLTSWITHNSVLFPLIKQLVTSFFGVEGVGVSDGSLGEMYYEQNQSLKAMTSLTRALSDANLNGSIRTQFAITAILARILQSEGQLQASKEILINIYQKAERQNFDEILPNISASIIHCALLSHDESQYINWLNCTAPDEHNFFYITERYRLITKARIYVSLGRDLEAIHIINYLQEYTKLYHRRYMQIELLILKAIIMYRRHEDWEDLIIQAVTQAESYDLIRIFADQGTALLPLWKKIDWHKYPHFNEHYLNTISKELKNMANHYPKYLQFSSITNTLTDRELEVLVMLSKGFSNSQISKSLDINLGTTKFHVSNIIKKLKAENRTVAVKLAQEQGLI